MSSLGLQGLSCKRGSMRFHRHAALNDVVLRSISSAGIPACLEPSSLSRSDGKRLDGLTLVPWEHGRPMIWDVTVPDTMAPSYRSAAVSHSGSVAAQADAKKSSKYNHLSSSYSFPIAIETLGAPGPISHSFIKSLGRRISQYTGDELAGHYLLQRLSVTVQRGNSSLIMDTIPSSVSL